jgi:hypothetical protein
MANTTTTKTSTVSTSWSTMAAAPVIKAAPTATIKDSKSASSLAPVTSIKPQPRPGSPAPAVDKSKNAVDHTTTTSNKTQSIQVLKPIFFDVKCTGLKPLTVHNFYYEGIDVSQYCTLITSTNMALPTTTGLVTDSNGSIEFKFNFKADLLSTVIGLDKTKYTLAGDKKFELKAAGSTASKIVPYKN